jgi:hypothetical protein
LADRGSDRPISLHAANARVIYRKTIDTLAELFPQQLALDNGSNVGRLHFCRHEIDPTFSATQKKNDELRVVAHVLNDKAFTVETTESLGDKVFVYGKESTDLKAVDYDAIAMLNVSATRGYSSLGPAQNDSLGGLHWGAKISFIPHGQLREYAKMQRYHGGAVCIQRHSWEKGGKT